MSDIVHAIGRFYLCPQGHKFDVVSAKDSAAVSPYPADKVCPTCGGTAPVQYDQLTHKLYEKCPFGQCPLPPTDA